MTSSQKPDAGLIFSAQKSKKQQNVVLFSGEVLGNCVWVTMVLFPYCFLTFHQKLMSVKCALGHTVERQMLSEVWVLSAGLLHGVCAEHLRSRRFQTVTQECKTVSSKAVSLLRDILLYHCFMARLLAILEKRTDENPKIDLMCFDHESVVGWRGCCLLCD